MKTTTSIDWFTGVARYAQQHPFPSRENEFNFVPCAGWSGYDVGMRELDTNIKRYTSTTRPDMGHAVLASATALQKLSQQHPSHSLLEALWDTGFRQYRASRIDFAVDLYDEGAAAWLCADMMEAGRIVTKARRMSVIKGVMGTSGVTSYIGSRQGSRFIRIYDKNAESKGKIPASRFELQANGEFAAELWRMWSTPTQEALNTVAYSAINGLVSDWGTQGLNVPLKFILEAVPPPKPEPNDDAWLWLSTQVLPTLKRDFYLSDNIKDTLLNRLWKACLLDD